MNSFQSMKVLSPLDDVAPSATAASTDGGSGDEIDSAITQLLATMTPLPAITLAGDPVDATSAAAAGDGIISADQDDNGDDEDADAGVDETAPGEVSKKPVFSRQPTPHPFAQTATTANGKRTSLSTAGLGRGASLPAIGENGDADADADAEAVMDADANVAVVRPPLGGSSFLNSALVDSLISIGSPALTAAAGAPPSDTDLAALSSNWAGDDDESDSNDDKAQSDSAAKPPTESQSAVSVPPKKLSGRKTRSQTAKPGAKKGSRLAAAKPTTAAASSRKKTRR